MGKSRKRNRFDETDEERQERLLFQFKQAGRQPTPKPGHYHDTGERQTRRKDRKSERNRLRQMRDDYNG